MVPITPFSDLSFINRKNIKIIYLIIYHTIKIACITTKMRCISLGRLDFIFLLFSVLFAALLCFATLQIFLLSFAYPALPDHSHIRTEKRANVRMCWKRTAFAIRQ